MRPNTLNTITGILSSPLYDESEQQTEEQTEERPQRSKGRASQTRSMEALIDGEITASLERIRSRHTEPSDSVHDYTRRRVPTAAATYALEAAIDEAITASIEKLRPRGRLSDKPKFEANR